MKSHAWSPAQLPKAVVQAPETGPLILGDTRISQSLGQHCRKGSPMKGAQLVDLEPEFLALRLQIGDFGIRQLKVGKGRGQGIPVLVDLCGPSTRLPSSFGVKRDGSARFEVL